MCNVTPNLRIHLIVTNTKYGRDGKQSQET